jgi:hypothetical protein
LPVVVEKEVPSLRDFERLQCPDRTRRTTGVRAEESGVWVGGGLCSRSQASGKN